MDANESLLEKVICWSYLVQDGLAGLPAFPKIFNCSARCSSAGVPKNFIKPTKETSLTSLASLGDHLVWFKPGSPNLESVLN